MPTMEDDTRVDAPPPRRRRRWRPVLWGLALAGLLLQAGLIWRLTALETEVAELSGKLEELNASLDSSQQQLDEADSAVATLRTQWDGLTQALAQTDPRSAAALMLATQEGIEQALQAVEDALAAPEAEPGADQAKPGELVT